jgi:NADPH:quinone reductase-like Zn-dependent oxidoreductase
MMLHDAPAIRGIHVGPPSDVSSIRGRFDVDLRQINAAMMMELARRHVQGKIKPVIDRAMPMSELKAAFAQMGSRGVMGKLVMVN